MQQIKPMVLLTIVPFLSQSPLAMISYCTGKEWIQTEGSFIKARQEDILFHNNETIHLIVCIVQPTGVS